MNVSIEVDERRNVPLWIAYGTPVFTVLAALGVGSFALVALGVSPITGYKAMFVDTLTSQLGLQNTLMKAVPLILAGLAVYLPMKAQLWNIGAEGQIYLGAIAGTWVGLNTEMALWARLPLMFVAASVAGAFWAGVPAWLRAKWGVNEIITTLLLTFVGANVMSYLVRGPMRSPSGNFPQTDILPNAGQLPVIPGTDVHIGVFLAIAAVIFISLLMNTTKFGFEITFIGSNDAAAARAGMSKFRVYLFVFLVGGAFAAMAGLTEVAGTQTRLRASFEPGYGWTAIPIALLGRNGAFRVMLAATFFALLFVGGDGLGVSLGVPSALIDVIQALVILFLITAEFFKNYQINIIIQSRKAAAETGHAEGDV